MTPYKALVEALFLALTAPTEEKSQKAAALAEQIAAGLTPSQVERAKGTALKRYTKT